MNWLRGRHRLEYIVFRAIVCVVGMLSPTRGRDLAEGLALVFTRMLPRKLTRYEVARDNLRQALGPDVSDRAIDEHIHRMWVHLFRVVIEITQLPRKVRDDNFLEVIKGKFDYFDNDSNYALPDFDLPKSHWVHLQYYDIGRNCRRHWVDN